MMDESQQVQQEPSRVHWPVTVAMFIWMGVAAIAWVDNWRLRSSVEEVTDHARGWEALAREAADNAERALRVIRQRDAAYEAAQVVRTRIQLDHEAWTHVDPNGARVVHAGGPWGEHCHVLPQVVVGEGLTIEAEVGATNRVLMREAGDMPVELVRIDPEAVSRCMGITIDPREADTIEPVIATSVWGQ